MSPYTFRRVLRKRRLVAIGPDMGGLRVAVIARVPVARSRRKHLRPRVRTRDRRAVGVASHRDLERYTSRTFADRRQVLPSDMKLATVFVTCVPEHRQSIPARHGVLPAAIIRFRFFIYEGRSSSPIESKKRGTGQRFGRTADTPAPDAVKTLSIPTPRDAVSRILAPGVPELLIHGRSRDAIRSTIRASKKFNQPALFLQILPNCLVIKGLRAAHLETMNRAFVRY